MESNPFLKNSKLNAHFSMLEFEELTKNLENKFHKHKIYSTSEVDEMKDITKTVNQGLVNCKQFVKEIGATSDRICGIFGNLPQIIEKRNKALKSSDEDMKTVQRWQQMVKEDRKVSIASVARNDLGKRNTNKASVSQIQKSIADIMKLASELGDEAARISEKLQSVNLDIQTVETQIELERKRAEERQEEERSRREEEERLRKEKEEKKMRKDEEQLRKEEEERLRKEERLKKEEEEKLRKEEEERLKKEVEEKLRKEEKERLKKEEEERLREEEEKERLRREEQERIRRAEQEKREAEEKERKRKAEDQRRLREEYERRKNPDNWPEYRYDIPKSTDYFNAGLGCLMKVAENSMDRNQLTCSQINVNDVPFNFGPQERCVSNLIHLSSQGGNPIQFEFPAIISIPYTDLPSKQNEPLVYVLNNGKWHSVPTGSRSYQGVKLATFQVESIEDMAFLVISSPRSATGSFNKNGGQIKASNDSRVHVHVKKNTFIDEGNIEIKVIPWDTVKAACQRVENEDRTLIDASSLVHMEVQGQSTKPVNLQINFPGTKYTAGRSRHDPSHRVHVMVSFDGHHWMRSGQESDQTDEVHSINIDQATTRVVLLRTKGESSNKQTSDFAKDLEDKLKETAVNLVLRQKADDQCMIYTQVCPAENTEALLAKLNDNGYTQGPLESKDLYLKEATMLKLNFKSNIDFDVETSQPVIFTFFASMETSKHQGFIRVVDEYIQRDYDTYRGTLQLLDITRGESDGRALKTTGNKDDSLLCELPVTLPKQLKENKETRYKATQFYGTEPLTWEYMRGLAVELGDEWTDLAENLGCNKTSVQRMKSTHQDDPGENMVNVKLDMLRQWHMHTHRNSDQAELLIRGLRQTGRHDLSDNLHQRHQAVIQEKCKITQKTTFNDVCKMIANDFRALADWKFILTELGLDSSEVTHLEQNNPAKKRACLQEGIFIWLERKGDQASVKQVANVLQKLGYKTAADNVGKLMKKN